MLLESFAKHDRGRFVLPGKTAKGLAQINAQNFDVHQMLFSQPMPATVAAGRWWEGRSSYLVSPLFWSGRKAGIGPMRPVAAFSSFHFGLRTA